MTDVALLSATGVKQLETQKQTAGSWQKLRIPYTKDLGLLSRLATIGTGTSKQLSAKITVTGSATISKWKRLGRGVSLW